MSNNFEESLRILVIDDNRDFADTLCSMLEILGYNAVAAYNGLQGIAEAKAYSPDIIFCDIGLPGMNGYAVAKEIRRLELLREVYLVSLSGYALTRDIQLAQESGFDCHIAKPIDVETMKRVLSEYEISRKEGAIVKGKK